jgi:hypothetical protein
MIVELGEGVGGVFETKTDIRRGYCQDLLSVTPWTRSQEEDG